MSWGETEVQSAEITSAADTSVNVRPFIRWAGSKRLLVRELRGLMPSEYGTYIEPFLGAGSLFLALRPASALLGDALEPLVETWNAIRDDVDGVITAVSAWPFDGETYGRLRRKRFDSRSERAAQFLYLNRGAYGGLWRVNRAGEFNVPWSAPKTHSPLDATNIRNVSSILKMYPCPIEHGDFQLLTSRAKPGDLVFLDPPYSKGHLERPFIHYNEALFDWSHQKRLAGEAHRLRDIGATVIVTNSTHPDIATLYGGFKQVDVHRHSSLGSHPGSARKLSERIFVGG